MLTRLMVLSCVLTMSTALRAADVESGPEKGAKTPSLKVFDCTGDNKDKSVDYADLRKEKLTVYLLIPQDRFSRPMARFMRSLDSKIAEELKDVYVVAVWLTDDEDKTKTYLPRVQMSVNFERTALTVFKGKDGPKDWNINTDAHLTLIVANKGKVMDRFGYNSINETEVPATLKILKKLVKK